MSSKHQNMDVSVKHEYIGSFLFLNAKTFSGNDKFVTSACKMLTITDYESFSPTHQNRELLHISLPNFIDSCIK